MTAPGERASGPLLGGILGLTALVFSSAFANHFLNWDDPANVTQNPYIAAITWDAVKAWFTTPLLGMYSPLVYLSYALDFGVGRLDPFVYHATNLLLHLLNVALVFFIARRLICATLPAAVVAVLFAVHPVNAAAVTPISVRSSLLSSLFYLGAYVAYLRYVGRACLAEATAEEARRRVGRAGGTPQSVDRRPQTACTTGGRRTPDYGLRVRCAWLWLCWLLFTLSLLAKSATVVFPLLLVATDWFYRRPFTRRTVLEKLPFLVSALAFGIVGVAFREDSAASVRMPEFSLWERLMLAGDSLVRYLVSLVAPVRLSAYYPYPQRIDGRLSARLLLAAAAIAIAAWVIARTRKTRPLAAFGALFFVIHLALVLKIVPLGAEWMADRYLYLPSIGAFLVVADLYQGAKVRTRRYALTAIVLAVAALSVAAHRRNAAWRDDLTFYGDIIGKYPEAPIAYCNRAAAKLRDGGDVAGALADCETATRLDPGYADAHFNCATAKLMLHRSADALGDADRAIAIDPGRSEYYQVRADARLAVGEHRGALADSDQAIRLGAGRPELYMAYVSRGIARFSVSDVAGALRDFDAAIARNPKVAVVYQNRANARAAVGDNVGALADYDSALALDPALATAYYYRGLLKQKLANQPGSCADFRAAAGRGVAPAQALAQLCR